MTGAQWVAHPGNTEPTYTVQVADRDYEITHEIDDFMLPDTEQYYCHHDPANHVLCTTTFSGEHGDGSLYQMGAVLPVCVDEDLGPRTCLWRLLGPYLSRF